MLISRLFSTVGKFPLLFCRLSNRNYFVTKYCKFEAWHCIQTFSHNNVDFSLLWGNFTLKKLISSLLCAYKAQAQWNKREQWVKFHSLFLYQMKNCGFSLALRELRPGKIDFRACNGAILSSFAVSKWFYLKLLTL